MALSEEKQTTREIVSIDPITLNSYSFSKNEIKLHKLEKSNKDSFFITYLPTRDILYSTIDINANIPESDFKDAIEVKVYDELGLDPSIDYSIHHSEIESKDSKSRSFSVFIVDTALIKAKMTPIAEKTKYIDFVSTPPFLIKALYQKNLVEPDGVHCFIYFQKNDAFLAIYSNGEHLYSKSFQYSLKEINEKFCALIGERIEEEDFYKFLINDGFRTAKSNYQQSLMQLFGEIFLYLNDVIVFAKRTCAFDTINRAFIGSEIGAFSGITEYGKSYLGLDSSEFNFSIAINSKEWYVDQIHILMMLSAQLYLQDAFDGTNFSLNRRPPPLKERPAGKLLAVLGASLVAGLAFPLGQLAYDTYLTILLTKDRNEYSTILQKTSNIRQQLAALKVEKEKIDALVKEETTKFDFRKKLLNEIYSKKISYPMKAKTLVDFFTLSNQSNSKVQSAGFSKNQFYFNIHNKYDKPITELISELTKLEKYIVNTNQIIKNEEQQLYTSKISLGLKNE